MSCFVSFPERSFFAFSCIIVLIELENKRCKEAGVSAERAILRGYLTYKTWTFIFADPLVSHGGGGGIRYGIAADSAREGRGQSGRSS